MKKEMEMFDLSVKNLVAWWPAKTWYSVQMNIKGFFRRAKYRVQRAKKGYCNGDLCNLDLTLEAYIHNTLLEFAEKTDSYPDRLGFTYESWVKYLRDIAKLLEPVDNPYQEEAVKILDKDGDRSEYDQKIIDKYWLKERQNDSIHKQNVRTAFDMLGEIWGDICY